MARVGEQIRKIRRAQKMSLERLGASLNLSQAAMSKIELGESKIDADLLPRIAELLGVSPAAFFDEEPSQKLPPIAEQAAQRAASLAVEAARGAIREEVRAALKEELQAEKRPGREGGTTEPAKPSLGDRLLRRYSRAWEGLPEEDQRAFWAWMDERRGAGEKGEKGVLPE